MYDSVFLRVKGLAGEGNKKAPDGRYDSTETAS
jgi:hypothetical protein